MDDDWVRVAVGKVGQVGSKKKTLVSQKPQFGTTALPALPVFINFSPLLPISNFSAMSCWCMWQGRARASITAKQEQAKRGDRGEATVCAKLWYGLIGVVFVRMRFHSLGFENLM